MPLPTPVLHTTIDGRAPTRQGKVRDLYDCGHALLVVATDRISAFDHVLATGIPDKGRVLTQLSAFWFERTRAVVPNHVVSLNLDDFPAEVRADAATFRGRTMLVRRAQPLTIECVARGYLAGSGWKDYLATGEVCGIRLPPGLRESDRLPHPIFTPATKASTGHDLNISEGAAGRILGRRLLERVRDLTLRLYADGAAYAESRGILVADTKFEFGLALDGHGDEAADTLESDGGDRLLLIDEVLTPDSSRFWPRDLYAPGRAQASFDKQFVRDYLESIRWNKEPPAPPLPEDVAARTREKYLEAFSRLTGHDLP